jgi:hypothetical protein
MQSKTTTAVNDAFNVAKTLNWRANQRQKSITAAHGPARPFRSPARISAGDGIPAFQTFATSLSP